MRSLRPAGVLVVLALGAPHAAAQDAPPAAEPVPAAPATQQEVAAPASAPESPAALDELPPETEAPPEGSSEADRQVDEPSSDPDEQNQAGTPAVDAVAPPDAEDLPPAEGPAMARELGMGALGLVPAGLLWIPTLGACCVATGLLASVYPLSLADPTSQRAGDPSQRLWTTACSWGCLLGCGAWLAALPVTLLGGVINVAGFSVMATGTWAAQRLRQWLGQSVASVMAAAAGVLAVPVGLALVVVAGAAFYAALVGYYIVANPISQPGPMIRLWWLGLNGVVVGMTLVTLLAVTSAALLPPLAMLGTYAGVTRVAWGIRGLEE